MKFGSGKTVIGPRPLVIADENGQIIYGRATLKQARKDYETLNLTEDEKRQLPAPVCYLAPIFLEIFIAYLRVCHGNHPVVRRRFPDSRNLLVNEEILQEISR